MLFPSEQWVQVLVDACNADEDFVAAGAGWDGAVGCVIGPDAIAGSEALYLRLDGRDGVWTGHELGPDPALIASTVFVLRAGPTTWKAVIRQELHPIRGMVTGQVRVRGQLSSVLRWSRPLVMMTQIAGRIETTFSDELP